MPAFAGQVASPSDYNIDTKKTVARAKRTTPSSTTTTSVGVLRLDGVPLKSGRLYRVKTSPLHLDSTVNNDVIQAYFAYTTDGSTATTASTVLAIGQQLQANATYQIPVSFDNSYVPGSDLSMSLLLVAFRAAGTGNVSIYGDVTLPIEIYIDDCGVDPGNTGVNI
jgi:hypothetical protein